MVLEKILESPLDFKEIHPVHPKGNQSWISIGRTDAEAKTPILWPPDAKNWLNGKAPDAGEDWRWEEKGTTEDEMVGWQHQLNGHEFEQAPGVGDGQGGLAGCRPWCHTESDTTEWCQKIWKTQQWPQDWKRSVFIPIPKKGNPKECSNYRTIALISHASKVMLKILQARL